MFTSHVSCETTHRDCLSRAGGRGIRAEDDVLLGVDGIGHTKFAEDVVIGRVLGPSAEVGAIVPLGSFVAISVAVIGDGGEGPIGGEKLLDTSGVGELTHDVSM